MSLVSNERAKLSANLLNTLASALMIVGGVTPLAAWAFAVPSAPGGDGLSFFLIASAFVAAGVVLHLVARALLGSLR